MAESPFEQRIGVVLARVAAACARSGRDPETVSVLAVTKNVGPDAVAEAARGGLRHFGESRIQEARQKIPLCPGQLEWHFVGHLQTNKVKEAARLFSMIHSVDSERLLAALDSACEAAGTRMNAFIEVNIAAEGSKHGVAPEQVAPLLERAGAYPRVDVVGLMTIPPFRAEPEEARPFFRRLRELRDRCREAAGVALEHLSMGMSGDFEIAVEEGATWVRLGTVLFGPRRTGIHEQQLGQV
jgi:hypothetical protein